MDNCEIISFFGTNKLTIHLSKGLIFEKSEKNIFSPHNLKAPRSIYYFPAQSLLRILFCSVGLLLFIFVFILGIVYKIRMHFEAKYALWFLKA